MYEKSKFDLNDDIKKYLLELVNETINVKENYKYKERDYSNDKIIYMRNLRNLETGRLEGLETKYKMQQYKIKEQSKLRKGTKNYLEKHYDSSNQLTDIFDYGENELDVHFVAHYCNGKRYLIGLRADNDFYPTYTYVSFGDENNYEEYMVKTNQIVYKRYTKITDKYYDYLFINYIIEGTYPVNHIDIGEFKIGDTITFNKEKIYNSFDEMDAEYYNEEFKKPDSTYIVERK